MIHLIGKVLPYMLILYFLFRALKQRIYLLGIPFLFFFQYCVFFDTVSIFNKPGSLPKDVLFLIWLTIFWLIFSSRLLIEPGRRRINFYHYKGINLIDTLIICLIIMSLIGLILVFQEYTVVTDVLKQFFSLTALFFGFFLVKNIVCYTSLQSLKDFLFSIVLVNTLASVLYILDQGLHITLYKVAEEAYQQEIFRGEVITRVFWFMPVLWFFSIAYLIVFREGKLLLSLGMLVINLLAIFVSYTRSFLGIALLLILLYGILNSLKKGSISVLLKNISVITVVGVILFFGLSRFLPNKLNYFEDRVVNLKEDPSDENSNTLLIRFNRTNEIFHRMGDEKRFTGTGPVTEIQYHGAEDINDTTADMVWTGVVFRWGYIGLGLFILLYLISAFKAFNMFLKNNGILSQFGLLLFLVILSQMMESFTSWTFLNPGHFALGLWYFAVLSALMGFNKEYTLEFEKTSHG